MVRPLSHDMIMVQHSHLVILLWAMAPAMSSAMCCLSPKVTSYDSAMSLVLGCLSAGSFLVIFHRLYGSYKVIHYKLFRMYHGLLIR